MNNEEHTSVLRDDVIHAKEFKTSCIIPIVPRECPILSSEDINTEDYPFGHPEMIIDDEDGWDIPIGSNSLPREPNLDFTSIAEMSSKD